MEELASVIKLIVKNELKHIHTSLPAIVESYDYNTQSASVKPQIKQKYRGIATSLPKIVKVPVILPGSGNTSIEFSLKKGDQVLLIFCERSIDEFKSSGNESLPMLERTFDLSDAYAIPGKISFNKKGKLSKKDNFEITHGNFKIAISNSGKIAIGVNGTELLKVISDLLNALIVSTVATQAGPQMLSKSIDGTFLQLLTQLELIRGEL